MFLLYIDESGNEDNPADNYFVQAKHFPGVPPVPFHAQHIRGGKDFWRNVDEAKRAEVLADLATAIASSNRPGVVLFAAAIEKTNLLYGEAAVEQATAEICRRFDLFLKSGLHQNLYGPLCGCGC